MKGFFQLQRKFFSHWLWEKPRVFSEAEAFLDLLQLAAFTRTRRVVGASVIQLEPGQVCGSERYLSGRWGWSTKKVRTFLTLLEADRMVERQKKREGSIITLCNYARYRSEYREQEAPNNHEGSTPEAPRKQIEEGVIRNNNENTPTSRIPRREGEMMPRPFDELKERIGSLKPEWERPKRWSYQEEQSLFGGGAEQMQEMSEQEWSMLKDYLNSSHPQGAAYWVPKNRSKFVETFSDVFADATRWADKNGLRLKAPKSSEPRSAADR